MSQLLRRFRRDIIGILWLSIGIFLCLTLYSYNPLDPSLNSIGRSTVTTNFCGYFGSFLADFLYQLFGFSSWILAISCLRLSKFGFTGRAIQFTNMRWVWLLLLLVTTAGLSHLYFPQAKYFQSQIFVGGLVGKFGTEALIKVFNFGGVGVIFWSISSILFIFYTETSIVDLLRMPIDWSQDFARKLEAFVIATVRRGADFSKNKAKPTAPAAREEVKSLGFLKIGSPTETKVTENEGSEKISAETHLFNREENHNESLEKKRKVVLSKKVNTRVENWELPKLGLISDPPASRVRHDEKEIRMKAELLVNKLEQFNVTGKVTAINPGPSVTMFEFKPNVEVKLSNITKLADDLSLALSSESVRIIAPIPGRDVVGIETSNSVRETVYLKDLIAQEEFWDEDIKLPLPLGRKADGTPKVVDLRKMPHLLVAGSTGSGKSVFTVSAITSLLFRHSPKTLRLILVDPKQVDLAAFNEIPHLLIPPVRESKKAIGALNWAIREMEKRYRSMSKFGSRGLEDFNKKVESFSSETVSGHEKFNQDASYLDSYYYSQQPYIAIVVEEFGDLMAVDKNNVEHAVVRLAQMARACGIHLILAMQSPRKDVVTGLIKTNIPGRISFKVASKTDSRIILDESGAERLLTRGDMLFLAPGVAKPDRHHGPWISDDDINRVTQFWRDQAEPSYDMWAMRALESNSGEPSSVNREGNGFDGFDEADSDERYDEILAFISTMKEVSASLLQRRFRLGYPRAARLIEIFEEQGVVGPASGSKPRQVLVNELK